MKKIIVLFLIAFYSLGAFCQAIDGIGKLRLDMSLKEVRALFPKTLVKKETIYSNKKVYRVSSYTPVKGITCKDINMYFYKDTLYAIYINKGSYELEKAMFKKYGEPNSKVCRFSSIYEELVTIYGDDSGDYMTNIKTKKYNIQDLFYEWNPGNPFCRSYYFACLYEDSKGESQLDHILCFKNMARARCAEIEDELENIEKEKQRDKELEGL